MKLKKRRRTFSEWWLDDTFTIFDLGVVFGIAIAILVPFFCFMNYLNNKGYAKALGEYNSTGTINQRWESTSVHRTDTVELIATKETYVVVSAYQDKYTYLVVLKKDNQTLTVTVNDIRKVKTVE